MATIPASAELCQKLGLERGEASCEAFQKLLGRLGWQGDAASLWAQLLAYVSCGGTAGGHGGQPAVSVFCPGLAKALLFLHHCEQSRYIII